MRTRTVTGARGRSSLLVLRRLFASRGSCVECHPACRRNVAWTLHAVRAEQRVLHQQASLPWFACSVAWQQALHDSLSSWRRCCCGWECLAVHGDGKPRAV